MTILGREIRTVAVDFDGTLFTEDKYPEVGEPIQSTIDYVKYLKSQGIELILYTNREGKILEDAVEACKSVGLEFDAVNQNLQWRIDKYGESRKIGADLYLDDKALNVIELHKDIEYKTKSSPKYLEAYQKNPYFHLVMDKVAHGEESMLESIYVLAHRLQELEDMRTAASLYNAEDTLIS